MLCRRTEQVRGLELSYVGYVGFRVMEGLSARLVMFGRHGWQTRVVHPPPTSTRPFA